MPTKPFMSGHSMNRPVPPCSFPPPSGASCGWLGFLIFGALMVLAPTHGFARDDSVKRIGYLEAGHFWLFDRTYEAFSQALDSKSAVHIDYPEDAHHSPGWEPENMARLPVLAEGLMQRRDLDLIVGMGTAAVKALLAANDGRTPILGMGMADPVAAGVVSDLTDSGVDNFTCQVIADRWTTMFRVFHDVVRFSKLGVMYQNTPEGRVYAALNDVQAVAPELGFSVAGYGELSTTETDDECRQGLEKLRDEGMDAFFIGPLNCFDWDSNDVAALLELLNDWKIPTFARDGSDFVKAGALMGFSTWNFGPTGEFLANQAVAILTGSKPRSISMLDRMEPTIAINLETAAKIGFHFPLDVLVVSDEIFERTILPAPRKD
ncbi:MAG: hypothetical protein EOM37_13195 [Proteobacteria bacterium]|nr:hypothetical protein [Pseudomonadota bacterium]